MTAISWKRADRFRGHPILQATAMNPNLSTSSCRPIERTTHPTPPSPLPDLSQRIPTIRHHNTQDTVHLHSTQDTVHRHSTHIPRHRNIPTVHRHTWTAQRQLHADITKHLHLQGLHPPRYPFTHRLFAHHLFTHHLSRVPLLLMCTMPRDRPPECEGRCQRGTLRNRELGRLLLHRPARACTTHPQSFLSLSRGHLDPFIVTASVWVSVLAQYRRSHRKTDCGP